MTKPNRAASDIAVRYTRGIEIRTTSLVSSTPDAPAYTPEASRSGCGDGCVAHAALSSLLFLVAAPSSAKCSLLCRPVAAGAGRGYRCRRDEGCRRYISSAPAPLALQTNDETCCQCSRPHRPVERGENWTSQPGMSQHGA